LVIDHILRKGGNNYATHKKTAVAAAIAGIIGTVVFDLVGLIAMGQWWDIPALLAGKIGVGLYAVFVSHILLYNL